MKTATKQVIEVPAHNAEDVEFLHELEQAHDHSNLKDIGTAIERAFAKRIETEFLGQTITSKTRASVTDFCMYLLCIAKFYGYTLPVNGLIATIHEDVFSIITRRGLSTLVEATFTYFDGNGGYELSAKGFMRRDWATAPSNPRSRRFQIKRDNNDTLPGLIDDVVSEKLHILVEIDNQLPLLILPVE